jgi:hypothetical protein
MTMPARGGTQREWSTDETLEAGITLQDAKRKKSSERSFDIDKTAALTYALQNTKFRRVLCVWC